MSDMVPSPHADILVVDDDSVVTDYLLRRFQAKGYRVEGVLNPAQALKMVKAGNYHIVVCDLEMPSLSGMDLLKAIKDYNNAIHVIIFTGRLTIDRLLTCMRRGASTCILKSADMERSLEELDAALEQAFAVRRMWQDKIRELKKSTGGEDA